jgi:cell shape-determining protein MreC
MIMQPFKRARKKSTLPALLLRVFLIAGSVVILFFIIRTVLHKTGVPSLHADTVRQGLESKRALIATVNELQNQIDTNRASFDEVTLLQQENEALKAELGRETGMNGVLARVLTTPDRNFYDTILIDAGTEEGIQTGQIVYALGSIALGTVSDTRAQQSTVELFSAPNRETAGTAEGSAVTVTLFGRGAGEYEVRMPRDVHFEVGELVSLQTVHIAVLAKIEKIATDPRDPFQRLLAKAPVNLQALKFVVVR